MSVARVSIPGTLLPDGSLRLDFKPELPPGRVEVRLHLLRDSSADSPESWWDYLLAARQELEKAGHPFRTREEIDAELRAQRDEWNDLTVESI